MNIVVFTGPTIAAEAAAKILPATFLSPVQYGDVYRVADQMQPDVIGIIDGHFNQVPSVWHKEILWAMQHGIVIAGAASMGALRAAETDMFGMMGVGAIYEAYRDGVMLPYANETFEDDDEVAVVHAPAELGFKAMSDAMVNIRATLAAAADQSVIGEALRDELVAKFKTQFYPQRRFELLGDADFVEQSQAIKDLSAWLPDNKIDLKQKDAVRLLKQLSEWQRNDTLPAFESRQLEATTLWQTAVADFENCRVEIDSALAELRLQGSAYFEAVDKAVSDLLPNKKPDQEQLDKVSANKVEAERVWMTNAYVHKSSSTSAVSLATPVMQKLVVQKLKQDGRYETLSQRANQKAEKLDQNKIEQTAQTLSDLERLQLAEWFFEQHLGAELPRNIDDYWHAMDFTDELEFYAALLGEYEFCTSGD